MSERALQRMNHIAGARAPIKECGWSARSTGIGAACFLAECWNGIFKLLTLQLAGGLGARPVGSRYGLSARDRAWA